MALRDDLRNVAIIAHVDHGKTTLVDAMLRQTGALRMIKETTERILDSGDLEREKGITILAKHTSVEWEGKTITIVDTPGHADFGGEVERGLAMVDGVLLLVDATEGPLPQTRFVLRKALEARLAVVVAINKVDRPEARIPEVERALEDLFLELGADEDQIVYPVLYTNARAGQASTDPKRPGSDLRPLFEALVETIPAPGYEPGHPLQALVTNLDASPYVGRLAICRVVNGTLHRGQAVMWCPSDGREVRAKVTELYEARGLERDSVEEAGPGEIAAVAGMAEITVGDSLTDVEDPRPLPPMLVDEPSLATTIGINTSPLAGLDGSKLTARMIKSRLDQELVGNVSLRLRPTGRPDAWEVQGRGELQLAVLVETMRREGFELTVGKPQVVTRVIEGRVHEPVERVAIDVPDEFQGAVTQLLAARQGRLEEIVNQGTGWVRLEYRVPSRGLVGFRSQFLIETRGRGLLHNVFDGWEPWHGPLGLRHNGSMISDRRGTAMAEALSSLQERGRMLIGPGEKVYEGMVVGQHSRPDDMDVNPTREKQKTNMRSSTEEAFERLTPHLELSLEESLGAIAEDECVEVTPKVVRLRKIILEQTMRARQRRSSRREVGA